MGVFSAGEGAGFKMQAVAGWADREEEKGEKEREREKCPARGGKAGPGSGAKAGWLEEAAFGSCR